MTVHDPRFPNGPPVNGCARCRRDFASLKAFDFHRSNDSGCGALEDDPNWLQDRKGRWTTITLFDRANAARDYFTQGPNELSRTP